MENKKIFIDTANTRIKRNGIAPLMEWLEKTDFYTAPASCRYHLAVEGGLLQHSLNVYNRLLQLYRSEYCTITAEMHETIAILGLFHDLCKANCYVTSIKNVKVYKENGTKFDKGGRYDWDVEQGYIFEEQLPFGYHGPKSAFILSRFMWLTDEEHIAVANHMGAYDRMPNDASIRNVYEKYHLAFLLHTADCLASFIDEKDTKAT